MLIESRILLLRLCLNPGSILDSFSTVCQRGTGTEAAVGRGMSRALFSSSTRSWPDTMPYGYERPPEVETDEPFVPEAEKRELLPLEIRVEQRPPLPLAARITIFILGWL